MPLKYMGPGQPYTGVVYERADSDPEWVWRSPSWQATKMTERPYCCIHCPGDKWWSFGDLPFSEYSHHPQCLVPLAQAAEHATRHDAA